MSNGKKTVNIGNLHFIGAHAADPQFQAGQDTDHPAVAEAVDALVGRLLIEHSKPRRVHHGDVLDVARGAVSAQRRAGVSGDDIVGEDEIVRRAVATAQAVIAEPGEYQTYERQVMQAASAKAAR